MITVTVASFSMIGIGGAAHIEYTVKIGCQDDCYSITRRYRRFRELVGWFGSNLQSQSLHSFIFVSAYNTLSDIRELDSFHTLSKS